MTPTVPYPLLLAAIAVTMVLRGLSLVGILKDISPVLK